MKDLTKITLIFASLYLLLRFAPAIPISSTVTQKQDLFTVSGTGKVTTIPDTATVEVGINVTSPTVSSAQNQANTVINTISAKLKALGLSESDIKTSHYSIYPQYDFRGGPNRISGYQISTGLTITIKDLDKINSAIDTATQNGANTVSGVQLTVNPTRQKELQQEARQEAVKDAKSKAESLSKAAGLNLGRIINVQEASQDFPRPIYALAEKTVGMGGAGDTDIQPGSTDIASTITLSYETR